MAEPYPTNPGRTATPFVGVSGRFVELDILRGFALLGVLLANLQSLAYPGVYLHPLTFALYAFQVLLSCWWLSHHAQGPAEALWRCLAYGSSPRVAPRTSQW